MKKIHYPQSVFSAGLFPVSLFAVFSLLPAEVLARSDLTLKAGVTTPAQRSQTIEGIPVKLDRTGAIYSIMHERRNRYFAYGVEFNFLRQHWDYKRRPYYDDRNIYVFNPMAYLKKYFSPWNNFVPYASVGVGTAFLGYEGVPNVTVAAVNASVGGEFRWEGFGVYTELRGQHMDARERSGHRTIYPDLSNIGLLAGISFLF